MRLSENFSFGNPTRIVFGNGKVAELASVVAAQKVCLVTSGGFTRRGMTQRLRDMFGDRLVHVVDTIEPNPDLDRLDAIISEIRAVGPDVILGLGGGSAMDSAKVIAKAVTAPEGWSLATHFRQSQPMHKNAPLPSYVVPTTSGTGAEVTPFATVWDGTTNTKYSLANDDMYPVAAILDPELTVDMPREVTLSTGLDAVSQALESVWNRSCNAITFGWAISSLRLSLRALIKAANEPNDLQARSDMAQASLLAGLCISHTRTALAHSMSYPITAHYDLPHGFACSFTLPALFDFNIEVDDGRLDALGQALGYKGAEELKNVVAGLLQQADIRRYVTARVADPMDILKHVREMITPNRSGNNMRDVSYDDIEVIIRNTLRKYW
jgi:Alcohol dehydrogenase, class IV